MKIFLSSRRLRSLEFEARGFEDLIWRVEQDRAQALRIIKLIREVLREAESVNPNR
jgi:hypothetical protein